jgi:Zn-dependent protease with chaperone function
VKTSTMDFFGYQALAKRNTGMLIALFAVAVVLIILAIYFVAWWIQSYYGRHSSELWDAGLFAGVAAGCLMVMGFGSWQRISQIRAGGGAAVARMLGGQPLPTSTSLPLERRLLNVVEEMAIASGLPVPQVFVLEESGINAFAAGFKPGDTIIGVTRGAIEMLDRDQLQGVIAHEFSHILHGDTRLNMQLMGWLAGITLIGDIGISMMTMRRAGIRYNARGNRGGVHPAMLAAGAMVFAAGTTGLVIADLIKRAVSRQREFLADAAAVQFTRLPAGLAGALKIIGGFADGSAIRHPAAQKASHIFFGQAIKSYFGRDWWATHPPLTDRIRRLEPGFAGRFGKVSREPTVMANAASAAMVSDLATGLVGGSPVGRSATAGRLKLEDAGQPGAEHLARARDLLQRLPADLRECAHDPYLARAAVYALLLTPKDRKLRSQQLQLLEKKADPKVFRELLELHPDLERLAAGLRLPLVEMIVPTLRQLSQAQYRDFRANVNMLIKADHKVSLFEYGMHRMLLHHLDHAFGLQAPPVPDGPGEMPDAVCLLTMLAEVGQINETMRNEAFRRGMELFAPDQIYRRPDAKDCTLRAFDEALRRFAGADPEDKRRLLSACLATVFTNERVSDGEGDLLRIIADAIGVPLPPLPAATRG